MISILAQLILLKGLIMLTVENKLIIRVFTRTYHVKSVVQTTDSDFVDITLEDNTVVKASSSFGLTASKDYEFVFSTYNKFKDTTTNIFENSTIMEVKEINNIINQEICVN